MNFLNNWKEEKRSAYLYQKLSEIETNPVHKNLFANLTLMANKQAAIWAAKMPPTQSLIYHPDLRTRILVGLVQCFGVRSLRIALAAMKVRGMSIYQNNTTVGSHSLAHELDHVHRNMGHGNNIRAAIFGINDGLVSNASLIFGIAGAHAGPSLLLLTGIAGLLAGACSMGAGEYVSVRSQREMLEYQLKLEKEELELYPEEEAEELALIYEARGIPRADAVKISQLLIKNPEKALETLAREELGINPHDLVSPWGAAISSFISFAMGAFIPLLPFIFSTSAYNLRMTVILTGISLFSVGALMSLFTQRSALWSGFRMLLIGTLAGGLTYVIGGLLGVDRL